MSASTKGAARVDNAGKVTQLGPKPAPDETVTVEDVQDPAKLAKLATRILASLAALRLTWVPRRIDFEDVAVSTSGATVTLQHNFNGRVRWWLVGWQSSGTTAPILKESTTATDANTLVLLSYVAGTATLRVEEAG